MENTRKTIEKCPGDIQNHLTQVILPVIDLQMLNYQQDPNLMRVLSRFYVLPENVTIEDDRIKTIVDQITEHLRNFNSHEGNTSLEIEAKIGTQEFSPYITQD